MEILEDRYGNIVTSLKNHSCISRDKCKYIINTLDYLHCNCVCILFLHAVFVVAGERRSLVNILNRQTI